jgi:hypothetical protein
MSALGQKQTCATQNLVSAKGQKRTSETLGVRRKPAFRLKGRVANLFPGGVRNAVIQK